MLLLLVVVVVVVVVSRGSVLRVHGKEKETTTRTENSESQCDSCSSETSREQYKARRLDADRRGTSISGLRGVHVATRERHHLAVDDG